MTDEEVDDFTRKLVEFMRPIIREFMEANFEDFCRKPEYAAVSAETAVTEEARQAAFNAAWGQFQRMPSSNPSDYAHAILRALEERGKP